MFLFLVLLLAFPKPTTVHSQGEIEAKRFAQWFAGNKGRYIIVSASDDALATKWLAKYASP